MTPVLSLRRYSVQSCQKHSVSRIDIKIITINIYGVNLKNSNDQ